MPFDQVTLDAIRAADVSKTEIVIRRVPNIDGVNGGSLATEALFGNGGVDPPHEALGDTDAEALDNLLLVTQGGGNQVRRAIRVRQLRAVENRLEERYLAAKAARVAEAQVPPPEPEVG